MYVFTQLCELMCFSWQRLINRDLDAKVLLKSRQGNYIFSSVCYVQKHSYVAKLAEILHMPEQSIAEPGYLDATYPCHLISAASMPQVYWGVEAEKYVTYLYYYVSPFCKACSSRLTMVIIMFRVTCLRQIANTSARVNRKQGHWLPNCLLINSKALMTSSYQSSLSHFRHEPSNNETHFG